MSASEPIFAGSQKEVPAVPVKKRSLSFPQDLERDYDNDDLSISGDSDDNEENDQKKIHGILDNKEQGSKDSKVTKNRKAKLQAAIATESKDEPSILQATTDCHRDQHRRL